MTKYHAIELGRKRAKQSRYECYVIWSVEDTDRPGDHYHTADDTELETFYQGVTDVVCLIQPDGTIES